MKNLILRSSLILSFLLMTSFTVKENSTDNKDIIGVWEYAVPDAPVEYQEGTFTFSQEENKLSGFILIDGYKLDLENVLADQDKLTCEVLLEGEIVTFDLTFTKESFSGTASYSEGDLAITGRKIH